VPGRVFFVEQLREPPRFTPAVRATLLGYLVADAHMMMLDDCGPAGPCRAGPARTLVVVLAVAIRHFRNTPHVESLVEDEETHLVGVLEKLRSGRIVTLFRTAFTPAAFMICSWRSMARRLTAAPKAPRS